MSRGGVQSMCSRAFDRLEAPDDAPAELADGTDRLTRRGSSDALTAERRAATVNKSGGFGAAALALRGVKPSEKAACRDFFATYPARSLP